VSDKIVGGAISGNVLEMGKKKEVVFCPVCGADQLYRMARVGFMRRHVFPLFGYYPWQCKECGGEAMLRKRNRRHRKHRARA